VLAGGVAFAVIPSVGKGSPAPDPHKAEVAKAFTGWQTLLQKDGAPAAPACTYVADALFCSGRGIGIARIDPATGHVVWSRPTALDEKCSAPTPLSGGLLGVVSDDDRLQAYGTDGTPGWDTGTSERHGGVREADDTVLTGGSGVVKAVDSATGKRRWSHALRHHSTPRFGQYSPESGLLPVFENSADGTRTLVSALRPRSGEIAWQKRLDGDLVPVGTGADGVLVLRSVSLDSRTDAVVLYDPAKGSTRRISLPSLMDEPKFAMQGTIVYLLTPTGRLLALNTAAPGGRVLWELETAASTVSVPVVGPGDRLYFSASDGRLLAVDTARGALLGQTGPRLRDGRLGYATTVPAPVVAGDRVFGTAPDGSVFAVDARDPAAW
ncbi:PQQ-binding-like beta-propeller repeat protein, partial [Streptomyces sp. NRRL B-24572]|uniref:PQQ-binding-like beta-propeller repeat protein n=1 Tax=Streptomyces sp. NRRL B-24572 TaxID=1962156 RepID=UPI0015C4FC88